MAPWLDETSKSLAVESPANDCDQRNTHEVQGHNQSPHRRIIGTRYSGNSVDVSPAMPTPIAGKMWRGFETQKHGRVAADERERELDYRHPKIRCQRWSRFFCQLFGCDHGVMA